jgi:hypothetical protein
MRTSVARRPTGATIADAAIGLALVGSAAFFIIVMEFCVGHGELTQAELSLLGAKVRVAHSSPTAQRPIKNEYGNRGETSWPTAPLERRTH